MTGVIDARRSYSSSGDFIFNYISSGGVSMMSLLSYKKNKIATGAARQPINIHAKITKLKDSAKTDEESEVSDEL